jgi:hypothetical protein
LTAIRGDLQVLDAAASAPAHTQITDTLTIYKCDRFKGIT